MANRRWRRGSPDRGERGAHRGPLLRGDGGHHLLRGLGHPLDEPDLRGEPAARAVLRARHLHRHPAISRRPVAPPAHPVAEPAGRTARARLHRLHLLHRGAGDDGDSAGAGLPVLLGGDGVRPGRAGRAARHQRPPLEFGLRPELYAPNRRAASRSTDRHARDLQLHRRAPVRGDDHRVGNRGHAGRGGHRGAARVAGAQLRHPVAHLRPAPPAAHQRGDIRVRRLRPVRDLVLRGAAHLPPCASSTVGSPPSPSGAGRR